MSGISNRTFTKEKRRDSSTDSAVLNVPETNRIDVLETTNEFISLINVPFETWFKANDGVQNEAEYCHKDPVEAVVEQSEATSASSIEEIIDERPNSEEIINERPNSEEVVDERPNTEEIIGERPNSAVEASKTLLESLRRASVSTSLEDEVFYSDRPIIPRSYVEERELLGRHYSKDEWNAANYGEKERRRTWDQERIHQNFPKPCRSDPQNPQRLHSNPEVEKVRQGIQQCRLNYKKAQNVAVIYQNEAIGRRSAANSRATSAQSYEDPIRHSHKSAKDLNNNRNCHVHQQGHHVQQSGLYGHQIQGGHYGHQQDRRGRQGASYGHEQDRHGGYGHHQPHQFQHGHHHGHQQPHRAQNHARPVSRSSTISPTATGILLRPDPKRTNVNMRPIMRL